MDDLESRLSDGLARHAAGVPEYRGDVRKVARRGRNRRWAARGAGAVGALAILGGGAVVYNAANGGDDTETVFTRTPEVVVVPTETPTPTPEPTPDEAIVPDAVATPEATPTPAAETVVRDVFAVAANGWGVGLVGTGGDLFATLTCCDQEGEDWRTQELAESARGALRVRDDLRGGIVASTEDTLWLQPAASFGTDAEPVVIQAELRRETDTVNVDLWDVSLVDDTVSVLYSVSVASPLGDEGSDELRQADIAPGAEPVITILGPTSTWDPDTSGFIRRGAAWVPGGGHMELRQAIGGDGPACEWVEYFDTDPAFDSPFDPPTADGECPQDSIGAAAMNDEGQLAVIQRFLAQPPLTAELVVYDQVGNVLHRELLPETEEDQPRWTELDIVGSAVLVSRAALDGDPTADSVLRYDLGAATNPRELAFVGNPTFARSNLITSGLNALDPTDDRWFGATPATPGPSPDTDDGSEPTEPDEPPPDIDPDADPPTEPGGTPPTVVRDEYRQAVGRGANVVPLEAWTGTDGCFRAEEAICLGAPIADALIVAERLWGAEQSDNPDAAREGEPPPDNEHVYVGDAWEVHITETDGIVSEIRAWPGTNPSPTPPLFAETIEKLGAPAAMFLGGGEGNDVLWVFYDSPAAYVGYGHVEPWGTDDPALTATIADGFPVAYDGLAVNSIWIRLVGAG